MAISNKLGNKRSFWLIILFLMAFSAPICSAQNTLNPKKKEAVVKKITHFINYDFVTRIMYFDTLGECVLVEDGELITYFTNKKINSNFTLNVLRDNLTVLKVIKGNSSLSYLESKFNLNNIAQLKTCFQKLSGDSLIDYLNKIDLNKLFKDEDLKMISYVQYIQDTIKETNFSDGDTSDIVENYSINDYCKVKKSTNKKDEHIWVKYTLLNDSGKVTEEIVINGENDTSYHNRHYYKNNLIDESYFVEKGQERLYEKSHYSNGKLVKLAKSIGVGIFVYDTYHYNAAGNLEKVMYFDDSTVDQYEYY